MPFPPPAPVGVRSADQTPRDAPQSAGLIVLAVAMAALLAGVGLVWYINEQESNDDAPSGQPSVGFDHCHAACEGGDASLRLVARVSPA